MMPHQFDIVSILTVVVFVIIFGLIIWEKMPRMYLAIFGAVTVLVLGVFDIQEAIQFISWETIGFLLGIFLIIEMLIESGFFRWVALITARKLDYRPLRILVWFPALAFFLAAFIDSITVMVFLTVVTFELSRTLKFDPVPIVVSEVMLANIGGAATLVGDPPNIILGTVLGFGFNDFVVHNGPIAVVSGLAALGVSYLTNRKAFSRVSPEVGIEEIKNINPADEIKDRYLLVCGLVGIVITLLFLVARPVFDMYGVSIYVSTSSLLPAFVILTFGGKRIYKYHFMRRIDAETIMFFMGLFILIGALEKKHIIQTAANSVAALFTTPVGFVSSIFWGSGILSAFVDNVPLAMAMSYIIKESVASGLVPAAGIMVWAVSLGVDMGGNLTPIGASANMVAYSTMEKKGAGIGWGRWLKLALPQGLAAMAAAYIGVMVMLHFRLY